MTEKVKKYLELGRTLTADFDDENEEECNSICAERMAIKQGMTIEELISLEKYVSKREFWMGIVPLIEKRTGKPYPRPTAPQ